VSCIIDKIGDPAKNMHIATAPCAPVGKMYNQKRRSEAIRVLKASEYGEFVQEKVKDRMVELALDKAWFKKLRRTQLRDFIVRLEAAYMNWFDGRRQAAKAI